MDKSSLFNLNKYYQLYYRRVYLFAKSYVHDQWIAEDIASDALAILWETMERNEIYHPLTFLFSIVKNKAIDYLRHEIIRQEALAAISDVGMRELNTRVSTLEACNPEGIYSEDIKRIKDMTKAMMDGLATKGYYEFENGNIISAYIWTKLVDAKTIYGHRLTAQCPMDKVNDPVLYPGWRGQKDNWEEMGLNYGNSAPATNLAIKGLFEIVSEEEAASLESQGYAKVNWGIDLVDYRDEYDKYLFWDYDYVSAPIYLWPFTPNVMAAGGFTNGYGFKQE